MQCIVLVSMPAPMTAQIPPSFYPKGFTTFYAFWIEPINPKWLKSVIFNPTCKFIMKSF